MELYIDMNNNFACTVKSVFLRSKLEHEFKWFAAKNQASDWLNLLVYQLEAWLLAENSLNLCPDFGFQKKLSLINDIY